MTLGPVELRPAQSNFHRSKPLSDRASWESFRANSVEPGLWGQSRMSETWLLLEVGLLKGCRRLGLRSGCHRPSPWGAIEVQTDGVSGPGEG